MTGPRFVNVTVNGTKFNVEPGIYSLRDFEGLVGLKKTASLSIQSRPSLPTTVNGNDSIQIIGGEVITSTQGA